MIKLIYILLLVLAANFTFVRDRQRRHKVTATVLTLLFGIFLLKFASLVFDLVGGIFKEVQASAVFLARNPWLAVSAVLAIALLWHFRRRDRFGHPAMSGSPPGETTPGEIGDYLRRKKDRIVDAEPRDPPASGS